MKYFGYVEDFVELRKLYYQLALKFHPDRGGSEDIMKLINNEYEVYSEKLINGNIDFSNSRKIYETQVSEELQNKINEILHLENLIIEIIGGWIWITGNTYPVKSDLKKLDFKFSNNKTAWYWHATNYHKRSNKEFTMDGIRDLWGSHIVEKEKSSALN